MLIKKHRLSISLCCIVLYAVSLFVSPCYAGNLQVQNFDALYRTAAYRRIEIISNAIARGMNIDSVNQNGDTGLCVAIRNNDYTAYQVFRHFGANPNHSCILRIPQSQYRYFMSAFPAETEYTSASARYAKLPVKNYARGQQYTNMYRSKWLSSPWVWVAGGAAVIAGGIALASHGGGGSKGKYNPAIIPTPTPTPDPDPEPEPGPGPGPGPDPDPEQDINENITVSEDTAIENLWGIYHEADTDITYKANMTITAVSDEDNSDKKHWGGIYATNGDVLNKGNISIRSESGNEYAAGIMACVVDSHAANTACYINDDNPIGGNVYNEGEIDIYGNQSHGIFTGNTQTITNTGVIHTNGDDTTGILVLYSADSVINDGTIYLEGVNTDHLAGSMTGIWVGGDANITNKKEISITTNAHNQTSNPAVGMFNETGTITNSDTGTIAISGGGYGLETITGTLINQNKILITNTNNWASIGLHVVENGSASNSGEINIKGSGYGMYITEGNGTNEVGGIITLTQDSGIGSFGAAMKGYGKMTNNGSIDSVVAGMAGDYLINNGTIKSTLNALEATENTHIGGRPGYAENNGDITTQSYGFHTQKDGYFINTGTITSGSGVKTDSGLVTNSGTITSTGIGIDTVSGAITNSGTLSSTGGYGEAITTSRSSITNTENAVIETNGERGIFAKPISMQGKKREIEVDDDDPEAKNEPKNTNPQLTINNDGEISLTNGLIGIQIVGDIEDAKTPKLVVNNNQNGHISIKNKNRSGKMIGIDGMGYDDDSASDVEKDEIITSSTIVNDGIIDIDNKGSGKNNAITGILINKGTVTNNGDLRILNDAYDVTTGNYNVIGIKIGEGTATNNGKILIESNNAIGMMAEYTGDVDNLQEDEIKVWAINNETIELVGENNIALYAKNKGSAIQNRGKIKIHGINVTDPHIYMYDEVNTGITDGCNEFICLENGGVYKNSGMVVSPTSLHFNSLGGHTLIGTGSKIEAPAIIGTVYADYDLITDNFDNVIQTNNDSFVGDTSELEVKSLSVLYTAQLVPTTITTDTPVETDLTNSDAATILTLSSLSEPNSTLMSSHAISLTRKSFYEFTDNSSVGEYLENNYALGNNMQFYNELKQSSSKETLSRKLNQSLGLKLFPSFSKQVLDNLRNINTDITNTLIANDNNQEVRSMISATSHYRKQDNTSDIYGFEDKQQSVFGIIDKLYNNDLRLGLGINYAIESTKFDENNKRKNNILHIFAPFMYNNSTYKFISTPHLGYIWGDYHRHTDEKTYKGDTRAFYYGLTNELSRDIALEHFILEPTAELNLAGLYNDKIKDSQGLNIDSHNDISAEIGIGLYLKKRFEFANKKNLSIRVGGSSYFEALHPYKKLHGSLPGMVGSYKFNKPTKSKTHSVLKASVKYQQDHINLIGELNKYIEDTDGYEFNLNMQYDLKAQ